MRKFIIGTFTFLAILCFATNSFAAYTYATEILWTGTNVSGSERQDTDHALGAPNGDFLSLDLGGSAAFGFGTPFSGSAIVFEVTNGRDTIVNYLETVNVYVGNTFSLDPDDYGLVTQITNNVGTSNDSTTIDLTSFGFGGTYNYLLLVDTTPAVSSPDDGFDVNAVGVNAVPIPAAIWLLGSGIVGLVGFRRFSK